MATRRPRGDDDEEGSGAGADDQYHQRRHGPRRIRPSLPFRTIVRRAVTAETIQQIVLNLEPVIRRVVREEIQNIIVQQNNAPFRSLPLGIQEVIQGVEVWPPLKLVFARRLMLPIYTNNKLVDDNNNPIEIHLIDTRTNYMIAPASIHLSSSIRLEVLVLDGEFRCEDRDGWTVDQFNAAIVRPREGKRPLLVGTLNVAMNSHGMSVIDDVSFTDNSSWIRSRKFRIGVRIIPTSSFGVRIQEAVSESFTVRDHRGELYKKHYPPSLTDNVWRLRNIGKEGPIARRLEAEGINNVQDFLKLNTIDPEKLRSLVNMSDKQWNATLKHAKMCSMGGKCYVYKTEGCEITFSPIGEILTARIGDHICSFHELHPQQKVHVKELATQAYQQWGQLEEVANDQMLPLAAIKTLIPGSSSGWQGSESQGSMISSGSQSLKYVDSVGTPTSSAAAAAMAANSSFAPDAAAAVSPDDAMALWSPSPAANDHFGWQNTNDLGGRWDEVD